MESPLCSLGRDVILVYHTKKGYGRAILPVTALEKDFDSMNSNPVARYVEIKKRIAELEAELDDLKDEVFADVEEKGGEIDNVDFVIRSVKQPRYRFSDQYDKQKSKLKDLRKTEIENGTAVIESLTEYVKLNLKTPKTD